MHDTIGCNQLHQQWCLQIPVGKFVMTSSLQRLHSLKLVGEMTRLRCYNCSESGARTQHRDDFK